MRGVLVLLLLQGANLLFGEKHFSNDINNRLCIFPFKYDGFEFDQCTTHKSVNGKAWCASEVDDYGNAQCHQKENCDDCSSSYPGVAPPISISTDINNRPCIFPFKYDGREFNQCTPHKSVNGRAWCASEVDDYGNAQCHQKENCDDCSFPHPRPSPPRPSPPSPSPPPSPRPVLARLRKPIWRQIWRNQNCNRLRIRKDVTTLTHAEKKILRTALNNAMTSPSNLNKWKNFQDIASFHGHSDGLPCNNPSTQIPCQKRPCPDKGAGSCCPHNDPDFLTWHRLYLVQLEELLEPWLAGTNLGLPYWDWSKDWATIPDLWEGMISPIKDSHAFSWNTTKCQGKNSDFSQRIKEGWRGKDTKRMVKLSGGIKTTMKQRQFPDFMDGLSENHNFIHNWLECSMGPIGTAAYDPIFWLHHSYVDKVFADWQSYDRGVTRLSSNTYLDPFNNREINKFYHRTHKTPDETLDYTENLCFCYDYIERCQQQHKIFYVAQDGSEIYKPLVSHHSPLPPPPKPLLQRISEEFEVYVAVVVPKHIGGRVVKYQVCREGNDGEDCSEEDAIALFGINENSSHQKVINSESYTIQKSLFLPSWKLSEPVEAIKAWTRIEVSDGGDIVPSQAPPFFVYRFKSDLEKVAHLPMGVQKEQYGDLLDDFSVRSYCGSYDIGDLSWSLGHPSICSS